MRALKFAAGFDQFGLVRFDCANGVEQGLRHLLQAGETGLHVAIHLFALFARRRLFRALEHGKDLGSDLAVLLLRRLVTIVHIAQRGAAQDFQMFLGLQRPRIIGRDRVHAGDDGPDIAKDHGAIEDKAERDQDEDAETAIEPVFDGHDVLP